MAWNPVSPELQGAPFNPLSVALRNSVMSGDQRTPSPAASLPGIKKPSKGQMILGILSDALAGAGGGAPRFSQHLGQLRQQEQEQAQWGLQRQAGLEDYEAKQRIDQRYQTEKPYRWEANDGSLMEMGPEGAPRVVYKDPTPKAALDPDVAMVLPDGRFYAGPRSGIASALMGQGAAAAQPAAPPRPVGKLTPITGGPTPQASGGFSR